MPTLEKYGKMVMNQKATQQQEQSSIERDVYADASGNVFLLEMNDVAD